MSEFDSKIDIIAKDMKHSENGIKTITEGVIQNTVKISEESRQSTDKFNFLTEKLISIEDRMEKLIESHISLKNDYIALQSSNSKVDSLIESHISLKNDYIALQSELASIKTRQTLS